MYRDVEHHKLLAREAWRNEVGLYHELVTADHANTPINWLMMGDLPRENLTNDNLQNAVVFAENKIKTFSVQFFIPFSSAALVESVIYQALLMLWEWTRFMEGLQTMERNWPLP